MEPEKHTAVFTSSSTALKKLWSREALCGQFLLSQYIYEKTLSLCKNTCCKFRTAFTQTWSLTSKSLTDLPKV